MRQKNQIKRIKDCIFSLDEMPKRHKIFDKEPYSSKGFRIVSVDNYCIFYTVKSDKKKVYIISVLYGRSNIENQLTLD